MSIPEQCPGTESEQSGKADACAGCPNQKICASTEAKLPDPDLPLIQERMRAIKQKVLVLSGKGGVGKTTFTALLALYMSQRFATKNKPSNPSRIACNRSDSSSETTETEPWQIGVLDLDVCGPSIPRALNCRGEGIHQDATGWSPVYVEDNLAVMSISFLLPNEEEAIIWRGSKKTDMVKQFLKNVQWDEELDLLLVDTPPGTSDEHLSIVQLLKNTNVTGAILISTPQDVALLDVRKEINFCKKVQIPIIGVVENMASFSCPRCEHTSQLFPATSGGVARMCQALNLPFLGSVPIYPDLAQYCDSGDIATIFDEQPALTDSLESICRSR